MHEESEKQMQFVIEYREFLDPTILNSTHFQEQLQISHLHRDE